MNGVVGTDLVCQVGFIVKDINATKKKWAEFLGVEEPEAALCGEYETTQTEFKGQPAPEANSYLAFFDVGPGLQLELIQPNEAPSTWRNYLNEHGEGRNENAGSGKTLRGFWHGSGAEGRIRRCQRKIYLHERL